MKPVTWKSTSHSSFSCPEPYVCIAGYVCFSMPESGEVAPYSLYLLGSVVISVNFSYYKGGSLVMKH